MLDDAGGANWKVFLAWRTHISTRMFDAHLLVGYGAPDRKIRISKVDIDRLYLSLKNIYFFVIVQRMKWNNDISNLLDDVVEDFLLLTQETIRHQKKYIEENFEIKKQIDEQVGDLKSEQKVVENRHLFIKSRKLNKSVEMQFNSNFLYAFTLFEKFISDVVRLNYKRSKKFRHEYKLRFLDFAKSKQKNGNSSFIDMLIDENLMIENYDELPHPIRMLLSILKIDSDLKPFERHFHIYLEARERRNLLVHRGKVFDKRYLESVKGSFARKKKILPKFFKSEILVSFPKKFKNAEDLIGESASISPQYFNKIIQSLIFLVVALHSKAFKLSGPSIISEGRSYASLVIHRNLVYSIDNDIPFFSFINLDIWKFLIDHCFSSKFSKFGFLDQVNYCLGNEYFVDQYREYILEKNPNTEESEIPKHGNYMQLLYCNNPKFEKHYEMAIAYFSKDVKKFLKVAEEMNMSKAMFREWFIFKRLSGYSEVSNFLKNKASK